MAKVAMTGVPTNVWRQEAQLDPALAIANRLGVLAKA
jgi:hypothetical protein